MLSWNTTLEHLSECVPVLVDKQDSGKGISVLGVDGLGLWV